jgi:histidinol-phosphate aminotransferase
MRHSSLSDRTVTSAASSVTVAQGGPAVGRRQWLGSGTLAIAGLALDACAPNDRTLRPDTVITQPSRAGPAHLDLNENPFGPSPRAVAAVREGLADLARYTGAEAEALQRQIALAEGVSSEQIVLGEVLEAIAAHLALEGGAGGEFVHSSPGYAPFGDAARSAGGTTVAVPLDARLANDLPSLAAKVNDRTRALFLVNPHNPSGTVNEPDAMKAFVRTVSTRTLVLVDEAYLEFTQDYERRTCVDLVRAGSRVAVFRTFSKIYGLAALPFGYAIAPSSLADPLRSAGIGHPRSLNRLAVVAAAASLRDASYVPLVRAKVARERELWLAALGSLNLRHAESTGNFVFFETGRPHEAFAAAMLARGVDVGRAFPPLDRWARISLGLPDENARARDALRAVIG